MKLRLSIGVLSFGVVVLGACGGGGSGGGSSGGSQMTIVRASHGFGTLLPHTTSKADDDGMPTGEVVALDTMDKLLANVTSNNPVDPPVKWPETATLPTGNDGNHFIYVTFSSDIAVDSVLDSSPSGSVNSGLKGTISVVATDPLTGVTTPIRGRGFIGGKTYAGTPVGSPLTLPLQQWVVQAVGLDGLPTGEIDAAVVDAATPGLGFPGTEDDGLFPDAGVMLSNRTFVYVRDEDGDLTTHETFPQGVQVRMRISTGVLATNGKLLQSQGLACSTVGDDLVAPELSQSPPPFSVPAITPGNGATGIDPTTNIRVEFTEPIQPTTLGSLLSGQPPVPSAAILVQFGPSTSIVSVPFAVVPASVYDLSTYDLVPAFNFPGAGPVSAECGTFNTVSVLVNAAQYRDLNDNQNSLSGNTFFSTGEGPGLVNAPVAPDVIYVGRFGSKPSISVIDLYGFGQGTGNPTYNPLKPIVKGNSNFPNNPNVLFQPSQLIPPLIPGDCTINGGSAGVFTIARDSSLNDALITTPLIESVGDMALGHALDSSFNNGPPPLGCQSGGGNICAQTGKKTFQPLIAGANTLSPGNLVTVTGGAVPIATTVGTENVISWGPHPNPPSLAFPPLCISPFIGGQEPTSIDTVQTVAGTPTNIDNLLVPAAFPLGIPSTDVPPNGLLSTEQNGWFAGPSPVSTTIATCQLYSIRQQIGHFLYVIDRIRREIVVLNSNRFTVIDRITVPDPTSLAISTNLNFLAVTNQSADLVSFVDIDPASSSFHTVVKSVKVGKGPRGIAWEPGNEDIIVCNEAGGSVSLISAASLEVRKTLTNQLTQPFDVAITPRQQLHGFQRNLYFAYILNRDGSIAFFESGPNGLNGWGFDDIVGGPNFKFNKPKAIQPDHKRLASGCWIVHEDPLTLEGKLTGKKGGAVSNLIIESTTFGIIPLQIIGLSIPHLRDIDFAVHISVGPDQLTGLPVDLAFDNQKNFGGLVNETTPFSAGTPASVNGKNLVRFPITGEINNIGNTNEPAYLFLAIPNSTQGGGVVEVIRMDSFLRLDSDPFEPGIQSIPVMGANILMDYFRQ